MKQQRHATSTSPADEAATIQAKVIWLDWVCGGFDDVLMGSMQ